MGLPINPAMMLGMFKQVTDKVEGVAGSIKIGTDVSAAGALFCKDTPTAETFKKTADDWLKKARGSRQGQEHSEGGSGGAANH